MSGGWCQKAVRSGNCTRRGARSAPRRKKEKNEKKSDRFGSRARIFLRGSENVRRSCQEAAVCQAAVMIIKLIMLTIMVSIIMMMLILPAAEHHQPLSITSS